MSKFKGGEIRGPSGSPFMHTELDRGTACAGPLGNSSTSRFPRLWAASVCILTFLAYLGTLRFEFVHDDRGIIVENPAVHSWHAVPGYFTSHVWTAVAPAILGIEYRVYRPLILLWFRINDAMFGHQAAGWHFTTVVAHVVAAYCVFLLAHRIFGEWPAALFSGLVFGLHPVHIEGVAWISGVPDALLAGLMIPAYLCWLRSREAGGRSGPWLGASLALYALAMLTKETAVVLPLILFASQWLGFPRPLDSQPRGWMQKSLQVLKALLPFLVLTVVYLLVRTVALKGFSPPNAHISWLTVVLTWPSLLLFYLKLLVWPVGLSPFYELLFVSHPTLRNTIFPTLVLLLVAGGLWKWASRMRPVALVVPWLVFPILPVLNIQIFGNGNFAHDRYVYLPSVGFALLISLALRQLNLGKRSFCGIPTGQGFVCLGLAVFLGVVINLEDRYYASDAAFYSFAYSRMEGRYPGIIMDFANTLAERGDFDPAAKLYRQLIQAYPDMWTAYQNLGTMYYHQNQLNEAAQYLSRAATGDPTLAGTFFYLGITDLKLNRLDEAETNLRRAVALTPMTPNYHFTLGIVLKVKGNRREALVEFKKELELNPGHQAAAEQAAELQHPSPGK